MKKRSMSYGKITDIVTGTRAFEEFYGVLDSILFDFKLKDIKVKRSPVKGHVMIQFNFNYYFGITSIKHLNDHSMKRKSMSKDRVYHIIYKALHENIVSPIIMNEGLTRLVEHPKYDQLMSFRTGYEKVLLRESMRKKDDISLTVSERYSRINIVHKVVDRLSNLDGYGHPYDPSKLGHLRPFCEQALELVYDSFSSKDEQAKIDEKRKDKLISKYSEVIQGLIHYGMDPEDLKKMVDEESIKGVMSV